MKCCVCGATCQKVQGCWTDQWGIVGVVDHPMRRIIWGREMHMHAASVSGKCRDGVEMHRRRVECVDVQWRMRVRNVRCVRGVRINSVRSGASRYSGSAGAGRCGVRAASTWEQVPLSGLTPVLSDEQDDDAPRRRREGRLCRAWACVTVRRAQVLECGKYEWEERAGSTRSF